MPVSVTRLTLLLAHFSQPGTIVVSQLTGYTAVVSQLTGYSQYTGYSRKIGDSVSHRSPCFMPAPFSPHFRTPQPAAGDAKADAKAAGGWVME